MSEEAKDIRTAEQFLKAFENEDEKLKEVYVKFFLNEFLKRYRQARRKLVGINRMVIGDPYWVTFKPAVIDIFDTTLTNLRMLEDQNESMSKENQAKVLGGALGIFLSACEYGLTHEYYQPSGDSAQVLAKVQEIARILKKLGKKVSLSFIGRRFDTIVKKHSGKLSPEKQQLFAKIAAEFSK